MKIRKKVLSFLLVLTLIMTSLPTQLFATKVVDIPISLQTDLLDIEQTTPAIIDINPNIFVGEGYEVEFKVSKQLPKAFDGEIIITNTGETVIEDWALKFDFKHEMSKVRNAELISHEGSGYIIKCLESNPNIAPGSSINISFRASLNKEIIAPEKYDLIIGRQQAEEIDYTIEYKVTREWKRKFSGEISITNNSDKAIEDWTLEFDFDTSIKRFWTAEIVKHEGNHYIIKNNGDNAIIAPGKTLKLEFEVDPGNVGNEPSGYKLNQLTVEIDYTKDTDGDGIPDYLEKILGTNPNKADTDNDGLPDGYEFWNLQTDPLEPDTDSNGILDPDEDFDKDGLINIDEYKLGTYPYNFDSDGDYLSDGDEVNKFGTDPLTYNKIDISLDSDADGLFDGVEMILGTDPFNQDTDGDGLSDAYEHLKLGTDPLLEDTDNNGIKDADEDLDKDGLSNIEEYILKTNPLDSDSDDDHLSDGDEVNIYDTNPLLADTDEDGLIDSDDILLGFNPLLKDSNGNGIIDSEERINQTLTQEIESDEKLEVLSVSVNLDCAGNIQNNVTINNTYNIDMLSSEVVGLIGVPVEINSDSPFEKATITFTYDDKLLGQTNEKDLAVMWYDEINDIYHIFDQDSIINTTNNTVSYTTTHFSTYLLVDRQQWYNAWKYNIDYTRTDTTKLFYDIGLVVDTSGSMSGSRITTTKNGLISFIDAMYEEDDACLIKFESTASVVKNFGSTKEQLKAGINSLYASGGTNTNAGLSLGITKVLANQSSNEKIIIMICDGDVNYVQSTIDLAKQNNIKIYTINIANSTAHAALEKIASETGGQYYFATTVNQLLDVLMQIQCQTVQGIDTTDTDEDGLYDIFETNGMRISNGSIITSDPLLKDTDGDGLLDAEEIVYSGNIAIGAVEAKTYASAPSTVYNAKTDFNYLSDTRKIDSDGDGILDSKERNISERRKYNEVIIRNGDKINRYIANQGDIHTFIFEPEYTAVSKIYTQGQTDTYMKLYQVPSYKNNKATLIASDNDSGDSKNAQIMRTFVPQKDLLLRKTGGYKIKINHNLSSGMGEYDILLKQTGPYEEAGFKDGDYTIIYAINPKGAFPFLVQLKANEHGQLLPNFINPDDYERFAHLNSTYVTGAQFASIVAGFTPVDVYKDAMDFAYGKDILTGEEINKWLLALCIITPEIIDQGMRLYGKNADEIAGLIKGGKGTSNLKFKKLFSQSADKVNDSLKALGYTEAPYKPGTVVDTIELTEQTQFVRVYDGVNSQQAGGWVMKAEDITGLTPQQIQNKFALPSTPKYVTDVIFESGTKLRTGTANGLFGFDGEGTQFDLMGQYIGEFVNPRLLP